MRWYRIACLIPAAVLALAGCGGSHSTAAPKKTAAAKTSATATSAPNAPTSLPTVPGQSSGISRIVGTWKADGRQDTLTIRSDGRFIDIDPQYQSCDGTIVTYGTYYALHANCQSGPYTLILTLKPDGTLTGQDAVGPLVYRKSR